MHSSRIQFDRDRAQLLMDIETAAGQPVSDGGMKLEWLPELHDRLTALTQRACDEEFGEMLRTMRRQRVGNPQRRRPRIE